MIPIALLIALGHGMRSRRFVEDAVWPGIERLTYFILFPALLLSSLAKANLTGLPVWPMMAAEAGGVIVMAATAVVFRRRLGRAPFRLDGPGFTSLFQCLQRPNTYVGLAAAAGLWRTEGLALLAICVAMVVPLVNLFSVLAMVLWGEGRGGGRLRWRSILLPIVSNPLIVACLGGMVLNVTGIGIPVAVGPFLDILGAASLALGLLAVGVGLNLGSLSSAGASALLALLGKMVLLPALVWGLGRLAGLDGMPLAVAVTYAALPASPSSYVLARQMGGDAPLVASILTIQTMAAALILPAWVMMVGG